MPDKRYYSIVDYNNAPRVFRDPALDFPTSATVNDTIC